MKKLVTIALMACLCAGYAQQGDKKTNTEKKSGDNKLGMGKDEGGVSKKDKDFAMEAADGGLMEVKLGQLAQTNAKDAEVKKHAMHMVQDHSKANEELKMLCARKNIEIPAMLGEKNQKKYDKMAKMSGEKFDDEYVKAMVKDHEKMVALFKKQAKSGDDAELKAWANDKIATLEEHLEMWRKADKSSAKGSTVTR
jgi:putative membrane protein